MTTMEHPQRERVQEQQSAQQANQQHAAEQRQAAAHVGTAVADARSERTRARHLGADVRRLEEAGRILDAQINGRDDMSVLRSGNALRHGPGGPEQGTGNLMAVAEFVHRVFINGELPYEVLEDMHAARGDQRLAPAEQHAQEAYQQAYRLDHAATVPAALPSGQPVLSGVPLPKREPGALGPRPSEPPMFPPAPPETAAEQTGEIFSRLRENGHAIPAEIERAARKDHGTSLAVTVPDPAFGAAAIPTQRLGDTERMPRIVEDDEEPKPVVQLPFVAAAAEASPGKAGAADD